jgi:hypothetical protein
MGTFKVKNFVAAIFALQISVTNTTSFAKDALGLDDHKTSVEKLTKSETPFVTKYGNHIYVYTIGKNVPDQPRFLLQGGLHGNELLGSEFVAWLAKKFANGESLLNTLNHGNVSIDFVPFANPDGIIQYTRYNSNKINLNRNFEILWGNTKENPGKSPFSEVETKAIRQLFTNRGYTGAIDVHGYANWIVLPTAPNEFPTTSPQKSKPMATIYKEWSAFIQRETTARLPGYEIKTAGGLGDGGAFEDYAFWSAGAPAACLELFSQDRFIPQGIAAKVVDLITPKFLAGEKSLFQNTDMFPVYESYVHSLFKEAIRLKYNKKNDDHLTADSVK